MFTLSRHSVRQRPALLGFVMAAYLLTLLLAAVPALLPRAAQAVTCFAKNECIAPGTVGNCDKDHCFEVKAACPNGGGSCYVNPPAIPLTIHFGSTTRVYSIGGYVAVVFNYMMLAAALVASVMFVIGGFQYLTAGESDRIAKAKKRITDALIGVILLLLSQAMLRTINPDLLKLEMPKIEITKKSVFASCAVTETCMPCGVKYRVLIERGTGKTAAATGECSPWAIEASGYTPELAAKYDLGPECTGRGCDAHQIPSAEGEKQCNMNAYVCAFQGRDRDGKLEQFMCGHPPAGAPAGSAAGTSGGYVCKGCKADGATCGQVGPSDECCGRFCAETSGGRHVCATGEPGDACQANDQCKLGRCQSNWGNSCSAGAVGSPCADISECASGLFCSTYGKNTCSPGTVANYCDDDSECGPNLRCATPSGPPHFCAPKTMKDEELRQNFCAPQDQSLLGKTWDFIRTTATLGLSVSCCSTNADCAAHGGFCYASAASPQNFCTHGTPGSPCGDASQCQTGLYCVDLVCTTGKNGSLCHDDKHCQSDNCYTGGDFDVCVSGGLGSRCDDANDCSQSMRCDQRRCITGASTAPPLRAPNPNRLDPGKI